MNIGKIKKIARLFGLVLLLSVVFGAGFLSRPLILDFNGGSVQASERADLENFWKVWDLIDQHYIGKEKFDQEDSENKVWGAIKGMVDSLEDPYSVFMTPEENEIFRGSIQGNFEGVGMEIGIVGDILTVVAPLKDTPAEKAGIKAGDQIIKIDEQSTKGISVDKAVSLIRGKSGTEVVLTILRKDETKPIIISITRGVINIPSIETKITDDGIFVIGLYTFSGNSTSLFKKAVQEFLDSKSDKLIIDLRNNPGGYLNASVDIASYFLPTGSLVVKEVFASGESKDFRSKGYDLIDEKKVKIAILVDEGSASASEILAGALSENKIGSLIGVKTFGKGSVQELFKITKKTSLKLTIAEWQTPKGNSISKNGLEPDIVIEQNLETEQDEQFDRAVDYLLSGF